MIGDTLVWICIIGAIAGTAAAFINPGTRPYVKKYWWGALILVALMASLVVFRKKGGSKIDDQIEEGQDIAEANTTAIDGLIDNAREQMTWADAELAKKRLESKEAVQRMDTELATIEKIDDSLERRKALIKVVETYA